MTSVAETWVVTAAAPPIHTLQPATKFTPVTVISSPGRARMASIPIGTGSAGEISFFSLVTFGNLTRTLTLTVASAPPSAVSPSENVPNGPGSGIFPLMLLPAFTTRPSSQPAGTGSPAGSRRLSMLTSPSMILTPRLATAPSAPANLTVVPPCVGTRSPFCVGCLPPTSFALSL